MCALEKESNFLSAVKNPTCMILSGSIYTYAVNIGESTVNGM